MDIRPSRSQTKTQIIFSGGGGWGLITSCCLRHVGTCNTLLLLMLRFATSLGTCNLQHALPLPLEIATRSWRYALQLLLLITNTKPKSCDLNRTIYSLEIVHANTTKALCCTQEHVNIQRHSWWIQLRWLRKGKFDDEREVRSPVRIVFNIIFSIKWIWVNDKNAYEQT